ncbi:MAG: 2-oxoacid:acceptor oxidoreductase subunit alpha [Candidatus Dadabacteria bacterium]|nr:MAG: 2-oxoacid:acceptor oxidoreductase subunit alpha [Candidatus Dadabacteria bacterium]
MTEPASASQRPIKQLNKVIIRFAGDSGDGIQVLGTLFSTETAMAGTDLSTLPNYPAEIRAPAGTTYGVSSFQIQFGSTEIFTPGDHVDTLVAFNPAALKVHLPDLKPGGILIVNTGAFDRKNLEKAGYETNPLEDEELNLRDRYRLLTVDISGQVARALEDSELSFKEKERAKNFWALGLISWLYHRPIEPTIEWNNKKFGKRPAIAEANVTALKAGYYFGETIEALHETYDIAPASLPPGEYRAITGNVGLCYGLIAAAQKAGKHLHYCSYPITPASDILHELSRHKAFGVRTLQMEDEIAAIGAAIGASYAGQLAVTGTSGPGLALKSEALGLAVIAELPLVVIDVQRGGPSTGLPTKTEQADLLQAMFGRNGESPVVVLAASSPSDAYECAFEAVKIAIEHMVPVVLLSDAYIANGSEPWLIPDPEALPEIHAPHPPAVRDADAAFQPYARDDRTLARPWAVPGMPGYEHRIGGLEKQDGTGNVSYDPDNHEKMTRLRAEKVERVANDLPPTEIFGDPEGDELVIGWGSTFGAIRAAVAARRADGHKISHVHLRYINPLPNDLGDIIARFKKVLVPEINGGQLSMLLRSRYLVDIQGFDRVRGMPLLQEDIEHAIEQLLEGN